ncbi:MAG: peptidoglycan DD-metalloendopeptidase family protein [Candidatus Nomurabacteria bacterium]|nr:peptidoglycan DD-metalloendopeptidase family protein [Candidatus Nomurabacteria bacterium]
MKKPQFKTVFSILALFLVFGVFFAPFSAKANFVSDLFLGSSASADNATIVDNTIQNTALQANVSPLAVVSKDVTSTEDVNILSDSALLPATSAMGTSSDEADASADQISVYVIRKGDSLAGIAKMFGVSSNTIIWANDLKRGAPLTEGDTLLIPPVSGVVHVVTKGQTLKIIAKIYNVDVEDITSFNDISIDVNLNIGDQLVIPGADIPNTASSQSGSIKQGGSLPWNKNTNMKSSAGYFIKPIPCGLTQGRHDKYAVDMSCHVIGTPIKAAAKGKVIFARYGKNGGYGNLVIIQHPNGMQTYYAHQTKLNVSIGDSVYQGQIIGYVGSTGHSTGPHLHFEVRGGWNPGFDNSWAQ